MTVNELYRSFLRDTSQIYGNREAANITAMIFEHFTGLDRAGLVKDPAFVLDEKLVWVINGCLAELNTHKPVQYIIGEAWFYKMKFKVTPAVLIPRPETEELVEEVVSFLKNKQTANIIDIGTGSGCIAVAVKKNCSNANVTATDISNEALDLAKENAVIHNCQINFLQADILAKKSLSHIEKYDVIVSNPPYIPLNELKNMPENVTAHEPHGALFVDPEKPLIFYEKIACFAQEHLKKAGKIFLETHEDFAEEVWELFNDAEYTALIKKDMFGKQRIVIANLSH